MEGESKVGDPVLTLRGAHGCFRLMSIFLELLSNQRTGDASRDSLRLALSLA